MKIITTPARIFAVILIASVLGSCGSIANFSQYAYQLATSLKVESLELMDKATEEYSANDSRVEDLKMKLQKGYEYAKGRADNEISTKQWEILISPDRNLMGGFLKRWKEEGKLSKTFVDDSKGLVGDAFDTIIGLESGKIKPADINQ